MYISKKELLQLTGISYGQLYRWKREGLIPESWFIKQSSYTGQETFFLKEKIVERIQTIQALKDKYSLDELAQLLSPQANSDIYIMDAQIDQMKGLDFEVLAMYKNCVSLDAARFYDFLLVLAFTQIKNALHMNNEQFALLLQNNAMHTKQIGDMDCVMVVIEVNNELLLITLNENEYMQKSKQGLSRYYDARIKIRFVVSLSEVNEQFRKQNKNLF